MIWFNFICFRQSPYYAPNHLVQKKTSTLSVSSNFSSYVCGLGETLNNTPLFLSCSEFYKQDTKDRQRVNKMSPFFMIKLINVHGFRSLAKKDIAAKRTKTLFSWTSYFKMINSLKNAYHLYICIFLHMYNVCVYVCFIYKKHITIKQDHNMEFPTMRSSFNFQISSF